MPRKPERLVIIVGGMLFDLELALTPATRERGLMYRKTLKPEEGMLFVFPDDAERGFWMKNTRVDLDIVYLDAAGRVVSTSTMVVEAPRAPNETEEAYETRLKCYPSKGSSRFAIEFAAGTLTLLKLRKGDVLSIPTQDLRFRAK